MTKQPTASLYDAWTAVRSAQDDALEPAVQETLLSVLYFANDVRTAWLAVAKGEASADSDALWLECAQILSRTLAGLPDNPKRIA